MGYAINVTQTGWRAVGSASDLLSGETFSLTQPVLPIPEPTLAQQANILLAGGLTVTSAASAALDGTYAADATTIGFINSEINAILLDGAFADGSVAIEWPDVAGTLHLFTIVQFKTLAAALGAFVSDVRKCVIGAVGAALPAAAVTIA